MISSIINASLFVGQYIKLIHRSSIIQYSRKFMQEGSLLRKENLNGPAVITFLVYEMKLQFEIPSSWSVSKIKCLLCTEVEKLKFNQFQLMVHGKILLGDTKIGQLMEESGSDRFNFVMTRMKSSVTFEQYYKNCMKGMLESSSLPVMTAEVQRSMEFIETRKIPEIQNLENDIIEQEMRFEAARNANQVIRVLQSFGWYIVVNMALRAGSFSKLAIIFFLVFLYSVIEGFRRGHFLASTKPKGQPEQNKSKWAKKEGQFDRIKAQILMRYRKVVQIAICLVLMLFPNANIQFYQKIMEDKVNLWREEIDRLRPGTYGKKWEIK